MKRPAAAELPGLLFLRNDDGLVLALVVKGTGRRTRRRADRATDDGPDRAPNDGPDDSAPDRTAQCAAGLLVAVALANKMARIAFAILRGRTTYNAIAA